MSYQCPRCKSTQNDDPGLCYSCKCTDFLDGKCDSFGNPLNKPVQNEQSELLNLYRKCLDIYRTRGSCIVADRKEIEVLCKQIYDKEKDLKNQIFNPQK